MTIKIISNKFQFIDNRKRLKREYFKSLKLDSKILFENKRKSKFFEDIGRKSLLSTFAG